METAPPKEDLRLPQFLRENNLARVPVFSKYRYKSEVKRMYSTRYRRHIWHVCVVGHLRPGYPGEKQRVLSVGTTHYTFEKAVIVGHALARWSNVNGSRHDPVHRDQFGVEHRTRQGTHFPENYSWNPKTLEWVHRTSKQV